MVVSSKILRVPYFSFELAPRPEGGRERGGGVESSIFHSLSKLTFAHARVRVYIYIYIYTLLFVGYTRRLNDCKTL